MMKILKKELTRRGITVDLFKGAIADGTACAIKEDWKQEEITRYLLGELKGKPGDFLLKGDKFLMHELQLNERASNLNWFLTDFLDEVERLYLD